LEYNRKITLARNDLYETITREMENLKLQMRDDLAEECEKLRGEIPVQASGVKWKVVAQLEERSRALETECAKLRGESAKLDEKLASEIASLETRTHREMTAENAKVTGGIKSLQIRIRREIAAENAKVAAEIRNLEIRTSESLTAECGKVCKQVPEIMNKTSLAQTVRDLQIDTYSYRGTVHIPLKAGHPKDGLLSYLTRKYGGNVHDGGQVTITTKSGSSDASFEVRHLADLDDGWAYFQSQNAPNQWVCWAFKGMRIRPTHYTVISCPQEENWCHPQSWIIEGSMDGRYWSEIDRQVDNHDLNASSSVRSFALTTVKTDCQFIRMTQKGKNHADTDVLALSAFEIFGTLIDS
jgi:hypothetical protein